MGIGLFSIIASCFQVFKESAEPVIPAENWGNKDLITKDRINGMTEEQILKNVKNGRYIIRIRYPEPHRGTDGKICIENGQLYDEDLKLHGAVQTMKWVEQGKYNLNAEELKIEKLRIEKKFLDLFAIGTRVPEKDKRRMEQINKIISSSSFDYRNTEALKEWRNAHNANKVY